jgi:YD repeat-containing protein
MSRGFVMLLLSSALIGAPLRCHAQADGKDPPRIITQTESGVNLLDLGFLYSSSDISIGDLELTRYYSSVAYKSLNRPFSNNWTYNFDITVQQLQLRDYYVLVTNGVTSSRFDGTYASNYPNNDEIGTYIALVGNVPTYTDRAGVIYRFGIGSSSKIASIEKPSGDILTFYYASNLLRQVRSNKGFAIAFDYTGSNVTTACSYNLSVQYVGTLDGCGGASRKVYYAYSSGRLGAFTDVSARVATYAYDADGNLTCPTQPGQATCSVTNTYGWNSINSARGVVRQQFPDGRVWTFDCSCGAAAQADPDDPYATEWSSVTKPGNRKSYYEFVRGSPSKSQDELGNTTTMEFIGRYPTSLTNPEGMRYEWLYQPNRLAPAGHRVIPKGGSATSAISTTLAIADTCSNRVTCNLPSSSTDARGNRTDYIYDPVHGGVLSETGPADSNGIRPVKRSSYVQRYAWLKNGAGGYDRASSPIWLLSQVRICRSSATQGNACAAGSDDEVVTSYEYGPDDGSAGNNLLLRGIAVTADGRTLRTCYGYDSLGNRISETKPRAGLAVCS